MSNLNGPLWDKARLSSYLEDFYLWLASLPELTDAPWVLWAYGEMDS